MAMMNFVLAYSVTWQGIAIEAIGYTKTLRFDAIAGLLCLAVLPFIKPGALAAGDGGGAARARLLAGGLALACLAWLPYRALLWDAGAAKPMFSKPCSRWSLFRRPSSWPPAPPPWAPPLAWLAAWAWCWRRCCWPCLCAAGGPSLKCCISPYLLPRRWCWARWRGSLGVCCGWRLRWRLRSAGWMYYHLSSR